jgi:hypothetical protein
MTFGFIYKIVFPNGKHYIGLTTTSLEQRTKEHKNSSKNGDAKCIYNAIRKYGMVDTLELIEIDTADTIEELCEKEIGYIIEYNSYYMNENGYNMTYGGEGTNGYVYTEEDRQKNRERRKKYFEENPDAGKQHSEKLKKYFENPEARAQMKKIKKKYFEENPEARQQISEISKKQFENPEAREQMRKIKKKYYEENPDAGKQHSEKLKKYFENPDARQKNSEAQKKYFENSDAIKKCSEAQKKRFENPDAGKQHSEKLKKYFENPDARKKNSEAQKKYYEENPDARQKNSEAQKKVSDRKGKNKPFDVFTIDGTFIKTFIYQIEAIEYLQKEHHIISTINISAVLGGKSKSSAGFVFKYK